MATKILIKHEWNVPEEVVYTHLFDDALTEKVDLALKSANRTLLSKEEVDGRTVQRFEVKANPSDIPGAAKKALPAEAFQWVEESVWDSAAKRFDWKIITKVMTDKIQCSGKVFYESTGSTGTRRIVEGEIDIKIPFVGRIAEKVILGKVEANFEDTGKAEGEYFAEMATKQAG